MTFISDVGKEKLDTDIEYQFCLLLIINKPTGYLCLNRQW